jgi:peptidyl-prolyl cis-trans isomerase A (cyclophilin A)
VSRTGAVLLLASVFIGAGCGDKKTALLPGKPAGPTPGSFQVTFETTRGTFVIEANRAWAPKGADRFYELVSAGLLDDNAFYRVVPKFIVQFGALPDPKVNARWDSLPIADDPRVEKNRRGTIAFAQEGPGSRTHQLFISLSDNAHLDRAGFVPIGRVVDGMGIVDSIFAGYREKPEYHLIATLGNEYLRRMFSKLDYIVTARLSTKVGLASAGRSRIFPR